MTEQEYEDMDARLHAADEYRSTINNMKALLAWEPKPDSAMKIKMPSAEKPGWNYQADVPFKELLPFLRDWAEKKLANAIEELGKL